MKAKVYLNTTSEPEILDLEGFKKNIDAFFLIALAIMVFFMQAGFALLEAGSIRYVSYTIEIN